MFSARFLPPLRPSSAAALESARSSLRRALGIGHSRVVGDAVIQNSEVALQRAHHSRVNSVRVFKNADLDAQIVALAAQINQRPVCRHTAHRFEISHTYSHALR